MEQLVKAAVKDFLYGGECGELDSIIKGACVIGYLKRELGIVVDPEQYINGEMDEASLELKKAFVTVLKYIGDISENQDMVKDIKD